MDSKIYKGSLEPLILKILTEQEEMYGYQLTKTIKEQTAGEIEIKEGSLYPLLHRLEGDGIITSEIRQVGNRPRKYYKITENGSQHAIHLFQEMKNYLTTMNNLFSGKIAKT